MVWSGPHSPRYLPIGVIVRTLVNLVVVPCGAVSWVPVKPWFWRSCRWLCLRIEAGWLAPVFPGISDAENGLRRDAGLGGNGLSADGLSRRYP